MSSLFIAGNGFDIAHGIPTKYSDFRSFITKLYPGAISLRDQIVYLEEIESIDPYEFAAEILLNTMDKASGENWCNFEEALAYINFHGKLPMANHKEDETDEEDRELMEKYLLYINAITNVFINCSKIWQELFRLWIKDIQQHIDNGEFDFRKSLSSLLSLPDMQYLSFNYTKTLQTIYNIKKVIHIHNRVGQKLIFGHEKDNITYNQFNNDYSEGPFIMASSLDEMVMSFKKDTESPLKKYRNFFKGLNSSVDKVYSYGFSYGKADSVYIKKIIKSISPTATWYFTEFESENRNDIRVKKIKLRNYGFKGKFDTFPG